jgi:hypothetical protein
MSLPLRFVSQIRPALLPLRFVSQTRPALLPLRFVSHICPVPIVPGCGAWRRRPRAPCAAARGNGRGPSSAAGRRPRIPARSEFLAPRPRRIKPWGAGAPGRSSRARLGPSAPPDSPGRSHERHAADGERPQVARSIAPAARAPSLPAEGEAIQEPPGPAPGWLRRAAPRHDALEVLEGRPMEISARCDRPVRYPPTGCRRGARRLFSSRLGRSQAVRHRILVPAIAGSNPAAPASPRSPVPILRVRARGGGRGARPVRPAPRRRLSEGARPARGGPPARPASRSPRRRAGGGWR